MVNVNFDFSKSNMAFDNDEALEKEMNKKNYLEPGRFELTIEDAYLNGAANDTSWHKVVLVLGLGDSGKSLKQTILIPTTSNVMYQPPGGKSTIFLWKKIVEFFNSIGVSLKQSTLPSVAGTYFLKSEKGTVEVFEDGVKVEKEVDKLTNLIGKVVDLNLGYQGHYIARVDDTETFAIFKGSKVVSIDGQELVGGSFDDCQALAIEHDIDITRLTVLKFHPKKIAVVNDFSDL